MLTSLGNKHRFCDNLTRGEFRMVGSLGLAGLSWAERLRLRTRGGERVFDFQDGHHGVSDRRSQSH
jgi:hypothetical protein